MARRHSSGSRELSVTGDKENHELLTSSRKNLSFLIFPTKYPRLWPETLPEEDGVRREGHMTLTRWEWAWLMVSHPRHLVITTLVRAAEDWGIFQPHSGLYKYLVNVLGKISKIF